MRRGGKRDAAAGGDAATPRPMAYDVLFSPEGSVQESDKKEPKMTKEARYGTPDEGNPHAWSGEERADSAATSRGGTRLDGWLLLLVPLPGLGGLGGPNLLNL